MEFSTIELLAATAAVIAVWMCGVTRLNNILWGLSLQTVALGAVAVAHGLQIHVFQYFILAGVVILVKAVAIPLFLSWTAQRIDIGSDRAAMANSTAALLSGCGALAAGYFLAPQVAGLVKANVEAAGLALSLILIGMLLMLTRRLAISQIIGFLVLENGIFLYTLTQTHGIPMLIEMGIMLDVLIGVLIAGLVIFRLNRSFEHIDVTRLRGLKH